MYKSASRFSQGLSGPFYAKREKVRAEQGPTKEQIAIMLHKPEYKLLTENPRITRQRTLQEARKNTVSIPTYKKRKKQSKFWLNKKPKGPVRWATK
jgi:hypothetical protein